jgi:protein-S-isoprenylcysteine O-methyltransferase Ste14
LPPMWLALAYIAVVVLARILTSAGRPRRTFGDLFRAFLDPTFHLLALTSLAAIVMPLLEYIVLRPRQLPPLNAAGAALIVGSGVLAYVANRTLGAAFTPYVDAAAADKRVVTAGIYRYIRHPLYTAGFMLTAGAALMLCSLVSWFFTLLCWAAVVIRTLREESLLKRNMDGYADYMRRTKRYVPGII